MSTPEAAMLMMVMMMGGGAACATVWVVEMVAPLFKQTPK